MREAKLATENGNAVEKVRQGVGNTQDESDNERMDDIEIEGADGCKENGGKVSILIQT